MNLMKTLKRFMPLCLAFGCLLMFDSCVEDLCEGKDCGANSLGCDTDTGECICEFGWYDGPDGNCTQYDACIVNETVCDGENQTCDIATGECVCEEGWYGVNCDSQNPCDNVNAEPCPPNSSCTTEEQTDADGNTVIVDVCECDEGFELNEAQDGCVASNTVQDFTGTYIQSDQDCVTAGDIPNVSYVTIVEDPSVTDGIILQGFGGVDNTYANGLPLTVVGHNVKAVVNGAQFEFSPNPQTVVNTAGSEVTFESTSVGSYNVGGGNGEVSLVIEYKLTSGGTVDQCLALMIKQ